LTDMASTRIHDSDRQAHAWLVHLKSGTATREDAEAFRRWCDASPDHAEAFIRARRLWDDLGPAVRTRAERREREQAAPRRHGVRSGRRAFLATAIGAAVAAVVLVRHGPALGLTGGGDATRLRTAVGEQRRVRIAPDIELELNTATEVSLRTRDGVVTGMRLRDGEALVHIAPSHAGPFDVELGDGTLLASPGASFAVRCLDAAASVTCLDGEAVLARSGEKTAVKPSQQVAFDNGGTATTVAVNPATALAWRDRVLIYDNTPLDDVVADINRYRPGRLVITDRALGERRVHARFTLDQMAEVASLIQDAYGAHATHLPGGWVLLS